MKHLFIIPLLWHFVSLSPSGVDFKISTKDTIYQYVSRYPHHCFLSNCPSQGDIIFFSDKGADEKAVERLHFNYPWMNREMCEDSLRKADKLGSL